MPNGLDLDTGPFERAFAAALVSMRDEDGMDFLMEMGTKGAGIAEARAPRGATGGIVGGIGIQAGRDQDGPYVEFGVLNPPPHREDFYQEFGTYKDPPQPFMRPALAELGGAVSALGGGTRRISSARSRGVTQRAGKRSIIRKARSTSSITAAEARGASRSVSSKFRVRGSRR